MTGHAFGKVLRLGAVLLAGNLGAAHAIAQESREPAASLPDVADTGSAPAPTPSLLWTLTASAGISGRDDGPNGSWQALSLSRQIGRAYARATVMRYHGTLLQADTALPSDYIIGSLAVGGNFSGWVADGWVSYGRQDYGLISTAQGTRPSTGASGSPYAAVGADFGKVVSLAPSWFVTPTVTGGFAHGKLLRPAPAWTDFIDLETDEPTWSASAAFRIDHSFGGNRHYAGITLSRNWTSNAVSAVIGRDAADYLSEPNQLESRHYADQWFEISTTANLAVSPSLHLDLFATRGFNMLSGDTTSAGISLRKSF